MATHGDKQLMKPIRVSKLQYSLYTDVVYFLMY